MHLNQLSNSVQRNRNAPDDVLLMDKLVVIFNPDVSVCTNTRGTTIVPALGVDVNEVRQKKAFANTFTSPLCISLESCRCFSGRILSDEDKFGEKSSLTLCNGENK